MTRDEGQSLYKLNSLDSFKSCYFRAWVEFLRAKGEDVLGGVFWVGEVCKVIFQTQLQFWLEVVVRLCWGLDTSYSSHIVSSCLTSNNKVKSNTNTETKRVAQGKIIYYYNTVITMIQYNYSNNLYCVVLSLVHPVSRKETLILGFTNPALCLGFQNLCK